MSRLDDLPPDQRATLSLLLRRSKSYAEVAELLSIQERAVHDRAHAALAVIAPREARGLSAEQREEVGDYLLGQRSGIAERLATRTYLAGSEQARAWADAVAAQLEPLAGAALPEIPRASNGASRAAEQAPRPSPAAESRVPTASGSGVPPRARSGGTRRGGALLLAGLVVVVIVAVVLIANGGGSSHKHGEPSVAASEPTTSATTPSGSTATKSAGTAKEDKRITLSPVDPASHAAGVAEVLSEGSKYAFYLAAERLPPSKGFFYAVWLYNSPTSHVALSKSPPVGSNGTLQGGALLPSNAGDFHTMLLTKETSSHPTSPGPVVLRGAFALH